MNNLNQYKILAEFLGQALTEPYEIILFDTTNEELPIIARKNRIRGSEKVARELVAETLRSGAVLESNIIVNIPAQTDSEKLIKTSVLFINNDAGENIGALCINMECGVLMNLMGVIEKMLSFNIDENRYKNSEPSIELLEQFINDLDVDPTRTSPDEKTEIICDLYNLGIFDVKGAVVRTAELLGISDKSVYRYISKIKKARSL